MVQLNIYSNAFLITSCLWLTEWSLYEVKLMFAIIPYKEEPNDFSHTRELAKQWVKKQMQMYI